MVSGLANCMGAVKCESCIVAMLPYPAGCPFDWPLLSFLFRNFSSASPFYVGAPHGALDFVLVSFPMLSSRKYLFTGLKVWLCHLYFMSVELPMTVEKIGLKESGIGSYY